MTIRENVPLAPLTTLQVGGEARYFAEAKREDEVREAAIFAKSRDLPLFILGGGSNLLVADSGWPGLVLHIAIGGIASAVPQKTPSQSSQSVPFTVGAGVSWDAFVAQSVAQNCAGTECLSGIPGSVGGTPVQNVGAYGQEVADTIESVRAFDLKDERIVILPKPACGFRYRSSIFNTSARGRYIILQVNFRLKRGGQPCLKYSDLRQHFAAPSGEKSKPPTLSEVRAAVLRIRAGKGMRIVPEDADCRSAGSFFKNPILNEARFEEAAARAAEKGLELPSYPAAAGDDKTGAQKKVSAAWLVEHSGFKKGYELGPAGISRKHALALINRGGAKTADIVRLKDEIQRGVQAAWGIALEPEPVFVGF